MALDDIDNQEEEQQAEEELEFFPDVVDIISMSDCSGKVATAINNQKKYNYQQAFQMLCSMGEVDPMLIFAIAAVETQGYPECPNKLGMFQLQGNPNESNVKPQITYAIKKLKEKEEIFGKDKVLEIITSLKFNDPQLDEYLLDPKKRPEAYKTIKTNASSGSSNDSGDSGGESSGSEESTTTIPYPWKDVLEYGEDYCVLLDACGYDLNSMAYYGKICMCYDIAKSSITGSSTLDQNDNAVQYAFPFATADLLNTYFISDYGVESMDYGAAKIKSQVLFKCKPNTPIHSPCRCTAVDIQSTSNGYTVKIPLSNNNGTLYYLLVDKIASARNYFEALSKDQVLGYTRDYFAIAYKDASGNLQDPKIIFNQLNGKLNEEESLGEQLVGTTVIWTNGDQYELG